MRIYFMRFTLILLFFIHSLIASDLEKLLMEYQDSSKNSLQTLNEKMGHVVIYTQEHLHIMQYNKLSDLLRELPVTNFNTNRFGISNLSLSGSKTDITGFFRLYINDHEVSSIYNQSPLTGWLEMPVSMIDHVEIYYGEGSFTLGNDTGVQFVRVYTKKGLKENGNMLDLSTSNKDDYSQSLSHSSILENGWSYLLHLNNQKVDHHTQREYVYLNLNGSNHDIDAGYTQLEKKDFVGYSTDLTPNDEKIKSQTLFIKLTNYFLEDKSLKTSFSYDLDTFAYKEQNDQGLFIVPAINLPTLPLTMPKEYYEDVKLQKMGAYISKDWKIEDHTLFTGVNITQKKYDVKERYGVNFANTTFDYDHFNDFQKETIYSFILQDDYALKDNLHFVANYKFDKYQRKSSLLQNSTESIYRVGFVYLPTQNLGFKSFYTKSYIPPSFYNIDFAQKNNPPLKDQKYKYFNIEGVYTFGDSKINIDYFNVHIDDFLYHTPIGFINVADRVKTNGFIFDYEYIFNKDHKLLVNYYISRLNRNISNSDKGGYIKYTGKINKYEYFTSLVYKNSYQYSGVNVKESFNLNVGARYNYTKNLSFTLQGNNLLNKPTKSLFADSSGGANNIVYESDEDYDRSITFGMRWLF